MTERTAQLSQATVAELKDMDQSEVSRLEPNHRGVIVDLWSQEGPSDLSHVDTRTKVSVNPRRSKRV